MTEARRVLAVRSLVIVHDLVVVGLSWVLAFLLRYDFSPPESVPLLLLWSTPVAIGVFGAAFRWSRMYAGIWRYASLPDLVRIGKAVALGTVVMVAILFAAVRGGDMPRSVMIIHPLLLGLALGLPRILNRFRHLRREVTTVSVDDRRRVLIIGAGDAAELLLRDSRRADARFRAVGLLDDDVSKQGLRIHDVPVLGGIEELAAVVERLTEGKQRPEELVIAIPSATPDTMRRIVARCEASGVPFRATPSLDDIVTGRVKVGELREVTIEDILSRKSVRLDETAIHKLLTGKRVVVTGAGGSIGSELCRQIARFSPGRLVLYELCEFNLYEVDRELGRLFPGVSRRAVLGDVRDAARVRAVFEEERPDIVLHAAAYKHVPLVEENPAEGMLNNVGGTRTVAAACSEARVGTFVLVSTDKAVNPANVMGATKRLAEICCQHQQVAAGNRTAFITVRFGNVLGSVGSVVPLFREQIRRGGPVTVTHPDMQRYFMTIPEAAQLILQAGVLGRGGEIFVLDMGKPVLIVELARDLIRLSGKEPDVDISIEYTGLRPGEKLFEELLYGSESLLDGGHEKIFLSRQRPPESQGFDRRVERLLAACQERDEPQAVGVLRELVPEFLPAANGVAAGVEPTRTPSRVSLHAVTARGAA